MYINQTNNYTCLNIIIQEDEKSVLLLIPGNTSIEEELINVADIVLSFYNEPKFENKTIDK